MAAISRSDTVRGEVAVEAWSSLVKAALGALGLALLAVGPLVPTDTGFAYLPHYAFFLGGSLVLAAATMRLRSMLVVLGCLALTAGLACSLAGGGDANLNLAALMLYTAAAVILGAAGRHLLVALPFLLVPLLIVAPHGAGWADSRDAFSQAWEDSIGCPCPLAGLPAALAVVGAAIGQLRVRRWAPVRPSAIGVLIAAAGLLLAGLVIGSLLPDDQASIREVCLRAALLAGVLGWIALAYQIGRVAFVWEAAAACLLLLAGALFLDRHLDLPRDLGPTLGITVAASLVPAALAGLGLGVRRWIGTERPMAPVQSARLKGWSEAEQRSFVVAASTAPYSPPAAAPAVQAAPVPSPPAEPAAPAEPEDSSEPALPADPEADPDKPSRAPPP